VRLVADGSPAGFVVGLIGPRGDAVGVGVLVGAREIVTCAHVVNQALGLDQRSQAAPTDRVTARFPLLGSPDTAVEAFSAQVRVWMPPPREGAAGDDLAGLVLTDDPARVGAKPARLAVNPPDVGSRVRVFGYPGSPPRPQGAWVSTTIVGRVEGGRLQLESGVDAALRVQPGYSGGPVCDEASGLVVGLVAAAAPRAWQ
jgi:Trypsin-like peptidase domain